MAKKKSVHAYELEIKRMIQSRNGEFDEWLKPQLRATAMNCAILDKIHDELIGENTFIVVTTGVAGQTAYSSHPLLPHYDKLQRTLLQQYEALGINYRSTPSKIKEDTKKGGEEHDKLSALLTDISDA